LIIGAGLEKEMDMFMWSLELGSLAGEGGMEFDPAVEEAAKRAHDNGVVVRNMRRSELQLEIDRFMGVYNEAWQRNWGFVPVTSEEVAFQAKNLKPLLAEEWAMI